MAKASPKGKYHCWGIHCNNICSRVSLRQTLSRKDEAVYVGKSICKGNTSKNKISTYKDRAEICIVQGVHMPYLEDEFRVIGFGKLLEQS